MGLICSIKNHFVKSLLLIHFDLQCLKLKNYWKLDFSTCLPYVFIVIGPPIIFFPSRSVVVVLIELLCPMRNVWYCILLFLNGHMWMHWLSYLNHHWLLIHPWSIHLNLFLYIKRAVYKNLQTLVIQDCFILLVINCSKNYTYWTVMLGG